MCIVTYCFHGDEIKLFSYTEGSATVACGVPVVVSSTSSKYFVHRRLHVLKCRGRGRSSGWRRQREWCWGGGFWGHESCRWKLYNLMYFYAMFMTPKGLIVTQCETKNLLIQKFVLHLHSWKKLLGSWVIWFSDLIRSTYYNMLAFRSAGCFHD